MCSTGIEYVFTRLLLGNPPERVLRFLDQKEIKALYHRVEKDSQNWGRLFIHFRFK